MSKLTTDQNVLAVAGVRWGVAYAGIKTLQVSDDSSSEPVYDLALMELAAGSAVAGVFTQNAFSAAPVKIARQRLSTIKTLSAQEKIYCLINSGNANAGTGQPGHIAAEESCQSIADAVACDASRVLPFSTGVIGQLLPAKRIADATPIVVDALLDNGWTQAARAIMTTDTVAKVFSRTLNIDGQLITLSGIAKGAGMIRPNMATMLAYVACDATIAQGDLDTLLTEAVSCSFNRITVDGDTSTNDACILAATGQSSICLSPEHKDWRLFQSAVNDLLIDLATAIIRDAEGASKFITIDVEGGQNTAECLQLAYTVAESPLVKTAFFASDANWGRILAAVGRSGLDNLDVDAVDIYLDDFLICEKGCVAESYDEDIAMKIMGQDEIKVLIKLNRGNSFERVWTSDLSLDYVRINADYRS